MSETLIGSKTYIDSNRLVAQIQPLHTCYTRLVRLEEELKDIHTELDTLEAAGTIAEEMTMWRSDILDPHLAEIDDAEGDVKRHAVVADPLDQKNAVVEVRPGTGGDEAALFAMEVMEMYVGYAQQQGWQAKILEESKEGRQLKTGAILFTARGGEEGPYKHFRMEAGVHRVQRVPATEGSGRVHTSTVTVNVIPEADERNISINPADLRIDLMRSSGAGGQNVDKTESAIRITHNPTNTVVFCQASRSQHENKATAMRLLQGKLEALERHRADSEVRDLKSSQVERGERSEKIRTYNFARDTAVDHRVGAKVTGLLELLKGQQLDKIVDALMIYQSKLRFEQLFAEIEAAEKTSQNPADNKKKR